jgi:hypothetical protein
MSEFKGTKGQWILNFDKDHYSIDTKRENICAVVIMDDEFEKQIANAKLIAVAPELLELVLLMKADFTGLNYQNRLSDNGQKTYQKILDVVKKATE